MGTEASYYYGYRGNWYGPFQEINAAWNHFRAKAESYWAANYNDPHEWYRWNVVYGVPVVGPGKELRDFDYAPKPLLRTDHAQRCRLCHQAVGSMPILYTEGYST